MVYISSVRWMHFSFRKYIIKWLVLRQNLHFFQRLKIPWQEHKCAILFWVLSLSIKTTSAADIITEHFNKRKEKQGVD